MAAPTFVAAGAGVAWSGATTTANLPYPAGLAAGDILVIHWYVKSATAPTLPGGGWARKYGPVAFGISNHYVDWVRATGSESGNLSVNGNGTQMKTARMYAYRGAVASGDPWEAGAVLSSGSGATVSMPTVTPAAADRLAVAYTAASGNNASMPAATGESGGDWVLSVAHFATATSTDASLQAQEATISGAISGGSYNKSLSGEWSVQAAALKPVPAAAVGRSQAVVIA